MNDAVDRSGILIRGTTDEADVAAVLAVLSARRPREFPPTGYEKWRRDRLNALHRKGIGDTLGL